MRNLSVLSIVLFVSLLGASSASGFDLDSLLVKSVGGKAGVERIRKLSTMHAECSVVLNGMSGTADVYLAMPDKMFLELQLGPYKLGQAFDGETAWARDHNGAISEITGYQKQELLTQAWFQSFSFLFDDRLPGGSEYMGEEERDGKLCHKVAFYPFDADTVFGYFDCETGLQITSVSYMDNLETVTTSEDYRTVEGIAMSFYSASTATGAPINTEFTITEVTLDAEFDHTIFSRPSTEVVDFHFPEGQDSVTVAFEYSSGHIYVPVLVNGKTKLRLILDSGASANIFHAPAVESLQLPVVAKLPAKGIGGYEEINLVQTDSLTIGDLKLYSQVAGVMNMPPIGVSPVADEPFGGVLGYDFLSRFPILIDYQAKTLTVYNPDSFVQPMGGHSVSFRLTMQVPTIEAELVGVRGDFIVDLGNAFCLIVHSDFSKNNQLESKLEDVMDVSGAVGGIGGGVKTLSAVAGSFVFGDISLTGVEVVLPDASAGLAGSSALAGNVGNRLLERFRVLFDYRASKLTLFVVGN